MRQDFKPASGEQLARPGDGGFHLLRRAIGTAAAIGLPIAVGGTLGYIVIGMHSEGLPAPHLGFVYLPALLWAALASVITAPLGARTAHRLDVALLRKLFAVLLLGLATKLMLQAII